VLAIGASDSSEGPYFVMPDGTHYPIKASDAIWMARRIKQLETDSKNEPEPDIPDDEEPTLTLKEMPSAT